VRNSSSVAVVVVFTALIVGSDFALTPLINIKLLDSLVFIVAFVFGFKEGAAVAVLSETTWSFVSPWGMGGAMTPFLVGGELIFALAGWWSARLWGDRSKLLTPNSVFIGAVMLICAFLWDFETNAATALVAYWPGLTFQEFLATQAVGVPFSVVHEEADFILGTLFAPVAILLIPKVTRGRV
jgi:uncharacterized membrane protein